MSTSKIVWSSSIPAPLFSELDSREVALWITDDVENQANLSALSDLTDLPWRQVISEINTGELLNMLRQHEDLSDPMVRLRGLKHVIAGNPGDINLPPRALPIFLLNGLPEERAIGFAARTRRQTMLTELARAPVKTVVLIGRPSNSTQDDLSDLWDEGFRPTIFVVSLADEAAETLGDLLLKPVTQAHGLIRLSATTFSEILADNYVSQRAGKHVLRIHNASGELIKLDVTQMDDPERPILGKFEAIGDADLYPLLASDLSPDEIEGFFKDVRSSWRPFAAGMPFHSNLSIVEKVLSSLRNMQHDKAEVLQVRYISSEDGAGASTLLRSICWESASRGFPALIASDTPLDPNADEVSSYMNRINSRLSEVTDAPIVHEVPWLIAFDRGIWDGHEDDLATFARRLEILGRQAVIIVVTGTFLPLPFYSQRFEKIADLTHIISTGEAETLGTHLNGFLSRIGASKTIDQWRAFYQNTTSHSDGNRASFWVALSFWLQGRFNLQETFDTWVYRQFKEKISDKDVIGCILKMSALAIERTAMPYAFLPPTIDFPISQKLSDARSQAPALGIVEFGNDYGRYWSILHHTVAEALLTGFFFDSEFKRECGFETSSNPTQLALRILTEISHDSRLAQTQFQNLAEKFATQIFKVDPERGYGRFTPYWREVLKALEGMPEIFRRTNRTFLHHTAISRRRIASDTETFPITGHERVGLLKTAINEMTRALAIPPTDSSEPDLNLYNSLARAYYDLANVEIALGEAADTVQETLRKAAEATLRAYQLNPDNSYVTETYAESLLVQGSNEPERATRNALEVLTLIYSLLERDESSKRRYSLTKLADRAFDLLLSSSQHQTADPTDPIGAIQVALRPLAAFEDRFEGMELADYPLEIREEVAEGLASPVLRDNPQAVKLRYILICIDRPYDFNLQLSLLISLGDVEGIVTPQMLLEKAILFYQDGRHFEGDQMFGELRRLWRRRTYYVEVPERLRWLMDPTTRKRRQVRAKVVERGDFRSFASVEEFGGNKVLFRQREFSDEIGPLGSLFSALVSFGHNGPFLRPLTAR